MSESEYQLGDEEFESPEEEKAKHDKYVAALQDTRQKLNTNTTTNNNNDNRAPRVAPAHAPQEQESAAARKVLETDAGRYLKQEGAHGEHDIAWSTTAGFRFRETGVDEKWTQ